AAQAMTQLDGRPVSKQRRTAAVLWRRPAPLGILSAQAVEATSSPGARALLAQAEATAERGLHIVRAVLWAVLMAMYYLIFGWASTLRVPFLVLVVPFAVLVWEVLRRLIWSPIRRGWLKYVLIALDGWAIVRPVFLFSVLGPVVTSVLGDVTLTRSEVVAVMPPLLVYLALSGAFRLDPRAAVASTVVALLGFIWMAHEVTLPLREALAVGFVIGFTGLIGLMIARILRVVALRAREEEVLERY